MKFTVAVSRDIYRCASRNVQFSIRRSSMACMLQRIMKNFVIGKVTLYINIGHFTVITNSEILLQLRFLSDLKSI